MDFRKTLWVANALLVGLVCWAAIRIAPGLSGSERSAAPQAPAEELRANRPTARPLTERDCEVILRRNVFGATVKAPAEITALKPAAQRGQAKAAPPLSLKLIGTVAGDSQASRALIEDLSTKKKDVYNIGDTVQGARIERIERQRVFLARDMDEVALEMGTTPGPSKPPSPPVRVAPPEERERERMPPGKRTPSGRSQHRVVIDRKNMPKRIEAIETIFKTSKLEAFSSGGRVRGMKITGLDDSNLSELAGLNDGDLVLSVNDQVVTGREQALKALEDAKNGASLDIRLLKKGRPLWISYRL
ncbi:MAG: hypothetical protein J7M08_01945 [Planctomycetes bacterium]|nr:hypothetical protein [Planctomycetota bacterium]